MNGNTAENTVEKSGALSPVAGQLIRNSENGHTYRMLYISAEQDSPCWWIDVDAESNVPRQISSLDLLSGLEDGCLTAVIETAEPVEEDKLSPAMKKKRDDIWKVISGAVSQEPQIYQPDKRLAILRQIEGVANTRATNLYRYLGKYWRGGKTKNALLPGYSNCGGHRKKAYSSNPGRHKTPGSNGKILTEQDFQNFAYAIDHHYLQTPSATLSSTYNWVLGLKYTEKDTDGKVQSLPPDELPSINQFQYWYRHNRKNAESLRKKEGSHKFELNHRPIIGKTEMTVFGPSEKVQIDGTIGDFYLVRRNHREEIIGRPVIFFVKDAATRMCTGLHVSLDDASWNTALLAIKNSAEDKVSFCRRYGIEIKEEDWPCHHLPSVLVADNGELSGKGVETLISRLGIVVENCPPYRGDLKGVIENNFHLCQGKLKDIVPGYVDKDAGTRGAADYRKDACMDFDSFVAALIRCVLYYNKAWLDEESYQRTPEMIRDGVNAVPLDLWNYGMKYCSGAPRMVSKEDMYRVLLPRATAVVTERGIRFQDLYYSCEEALQEGWFTEARSRHSYKVTISYDPTCVDHIYVSDKNDRLLTCSLLERSVPFRGMTSKDMELYQEENRKQKAAYTASMNQANAELQQELDKITRKNAGQKASRAKIREALSKKSIDVSRKEEADELSGAAEARRRQNEKPGTGTSVGTHAGDSLYEENGAIQDSLDKALRDAGLF